jgi:hypothetical protein
VGPISTYGRSTISNQQQLSYYKDEEAVARRLRELPEDDAYYLSVYGYTKQHYLAFLMAEDFTFQLYQATQQELNQEPFDCNALLLQEI